jgi:hypothetical protein
VTKPAAPVKRVIVFTGMDFIDEKQHLLNIIAEHHTCVTVVLSGGAEPKSHLFGYQSDMDLTEALFTSLLLQAQSALVAEDVPFGDTARSFTLAYWRAYPGRIYTRLADVRARVRADAEKNRPGTALVLKGRKAEVDRLMKAEHPDTRNIRRKTAGRSRAGRAAGYNAASRANLGNTTGISGGSASRALAR